MLTARMEERLLDVNPHEALPQRPFTAKDRPKPPPIILENHPEIAEMQRDMELYRMRTRPELYEEWQRDLIEDHRAQLAEQTGQFDWDCRNCKSSVMTYSLDAKCPRCGA